MCGSLDDNTQKEELMQKAQAKTKRRKYKGW